MTVSQLKKSCTTAQAKDFSNLSASLICVIATILLVIEVPMLVPITMGIAYLEIKILGFKNRFYTFFKYSYNSIVPSLILGNQNFQ